MKTSHDTLLRRRPTPISPCVALFACEPNLSFACGRLHEACGPARRTLALWLAAQTQGPVIWVAPSWHKDRLHPDGMADWVDPGRFVFIDTDRADDVLWSLEETLRSGAVPFVVGDLPAPPGLTQVRRLHLAAETGGREGNHTPLGLLLTPDQGGAQGVESRWHMRPSHHDAPPRAMPGFPPAQWTLSRLRARTAPQANWRIFKQPQAGSLDVKVA
ncbi:MAG: hypothetical protein ABJL99_25645 [Aliishimia sp.]